MDRLSMTGIVREFNKGDEINTKYNGVFLLIAVNFFTYFLDHILGLQIIKKMYLNYGDFHIYQLFTMELCHSGWVHISGNMFFIYFFGRLIEEEEGTKFLIFTYFTTGVGAALFSYLFHSVGSGGSVGASGAVFGLFVVGTMVKFKLNWRNIVEVLILGQFTITSFFSEISNLGRYDHIDRWAHVGGGLTGGILME